MTNLIVTAGTIFAFWSVAIVFGAVVIVAGAVEVAYRATRGIRRAFDEADSAAEDTVTRDRRRETGEWWL